MDLLSPVIFYFLILLYLYQALESKFATYADQESNIEW